MTRAKILVIALLMIGLAVSGCIKKVERPARTEYARYFPLNVWDRYTYSGPIGRAVVSGNINNLYTVTFYDERDKLSFWGDFTKMERTVGWKNVVPGKGKIPAVHFEPALPFLPWSHMVGDTLLVASAEIRSDPVNTHQHIQVEYEIMAVESIVTPAGKFDNCVKMRMTFRPLYSAEEGILVGDCFWWFALNVGVVKYVIPQGEGELMSAKIDGKTLP